MIARHAKLRAASFVLGSLTAVAAVLTWALPAAGADGTPERRARLAQADEEEKERLSQNFQRFQRLDPAQQDRLRRLNDDLDTAADKDDLRKVMQNYHDWLSELPPGDRADLASLEPAERLKKIDKILEAQRRRQANKLSPQDLEAIEAWFLKHDFMRKRWQARQPEGARPGPSPEDRAALQQLRESLSAEAQDKLDKAEKPSERAKLLWSWFEQARRHGGPGKQFAGLRRPSEEELQQFLKEEVRDEERSRLLSLPYDEMQVELRRLWFRHEFRKNRAALEDRGAEGRIDRPNEDRRRRPPDGKGSAPRGPNPPRSRGDSPPPDGKP